MTERVTSLAACAQCDAGYYPTVAPAKDTASRACQLCTLWGVCAAPLPPAWKANPATSHLRSAEIRLASMYCGLTPSSVQGPIRGLIVGEAPSMRTSAQLPMFPYPPSSSGGRLLAFSGMPVGDYLGRFRRRNLQSSLSTFSASNDARAAIDLKALLARDLELRRAIAADALPLRVVLLGARVASAFGIRLPFQHVPIEEHEYATIPHPSARSPVYRDDRIKSAASIALRWAAGFLA